MKKLFLLAATALLGFGADAQYASPLNIGGGSNIETNPYHIRNTDYRPHAKSSIAGGRWYNHSSVVDFLTGGAIMDFSIWPVWYDSLVKQSFLNGFLPINYISAAQIIDPIHFTLWNDPNVFDPNVIAIKPESIYKVDSVAFAGAYIKNPNRPQNVVDTLIFSVAPVPYSYYWAALPDDPWITSYVGAADTVKGFSVTQGNVDIPNRASSYPGTVLWKVPLTDADREEDSLGFVTLKNYTFPVEVGGVPGSVNIPAGRGVAVTVTFKTGDIVVPNTDTFNEYHHLFLLSGEALGANTTMPYYNIQYRDRNSSALMFFDYDQAYFPTVLIEGTNGPDFFREFHDIQAHIVCDNCPTVAEYASVKNVNSVVNTDAMVYPNPANNEVTVSFSLDQNTSAVVSISNAVGQVIATQEVGNVIANQANKVSFPTSGLAAGIYFYTVEAKGQRTTNRFVVSH